MLSRLGTISFFVMAFIACTGQEPVGDSDYPAKAPIPDSERTTVMILGTEHLRALGNDFDRTILESLNEGLDRYAPRAVAVESLPAAEIARLVREAATMPGGAADELLAAFAKDAVNYGREAQESLGLSFTEAEAVVDSVLIPMWNPDASGRRSMSMYLLAAYDYPSALLQWSYLPEEQRMADGVLTASIADFLNARLQSSNEIVSIGVEVARRGGLNRLLSIDNHIDDEIGLQTGLNERLGSELEGNAAYDELISSSYFVEARNRLSDAVETGDLLPMYLRINSSEFMEEDVAGQWHLFFRTNLPSKTDRARAALWEARNLNIAGQIRAASAWHSGDRILVVIGAAHKPFLDSYLGRMMDIEVVHLADVLDSPRAN